MGSFHTITTQGRSGSSLVSPTGSSTSTGAVMGAAGPAVTTRPLSRAAGQRVAAAGATAVVPGAASADSAGTTTAWSDSQTRRTAIHTRVAPSTWKATSRAGMPV